MRLLSSAANAAAIVVGNKEQQQMFRGADAGPVLCACVASASSSVAAVRELRWIRSMLC